MKLSILTWLVALVFSLPLLCALTRPARFTAAAKSFHRSENWGYLFMAVGTAWFLWNLENETIADFAPYKKMMVAGFGLVGLLTCLYVKDYLSVRGLAVVVLLVSKLLLDTARWNPSEWHLVISVLAYVWIVLSMWLMVSPWRLRDFLHWLTANERRLSLGSGVGLAILAFVAVLGATVF